MRSMVVGAAAAPNDFIQVQTALERIATGGFAAVKPRSLIGLTRPATAS